ncbi:MAG: SUMF1/EgtB/PvdO family nonheme iron enzyme, partial [Anaerolineales bacterium]|nr:SUMF1/EgtB/PvdO family nonheme iron enzyme [Anaerolineales bacterium]
LVSQRGLAVQPATRLLTGNALARLGDQRPGVRVIEKDGVRLPDIAWGEVVPAGRYQIGGGEKAYRPLAAQEIEIVRPYRLARYPVTYAQFQCFVEAADFADPRWWQGMPAEDKDWNDNLQKVQEIGEQWFQLPNRPRDNVSWYQAVAFCRWLGDKLGEVIDLPYEWELEVAARYPDGWAYPWGDEFETTRANTDESRIGQTTAVGVFADGANAALNLYDLSGNVWEWCRNKYSDMRDGEIDESQARRVLRGGSWFDYHYSARAVARNHARPIGRPTSLGFRVVVGASSPIS